ncbi:hypothetical protein [Methanocella sp. MCL-LM]|uniref:hypothetical protein n=1 Tax=Methanocella sp. MCL-LM TaxID=3412035 RepID=UPI003C735C35
MTVFTKYKTSLNANALLIHNHLIFNGDKHLAEISRETDIAKHIVRYQVWGPLLSRKLVTTYKVGNLTFVHALMPNDRKEA